MTANDALDIIFEHIMEAKAKVPLAQFPGMVTLPIEILEIILRDRAAMALNLREDHAPLSNDNDVFLVKIIGGNTPETQQGFANDLVLSSVLGGYAIKKIIEQRRLTPAGYDQTRLIFQEKHS